MTYYEILQVRNDASQEVIRAAYKILIQKFHPDRNADQTGSADMAQLLTQAYETLSQPELREAYDERVNRSAVRAIASRGLVLLKTSLAHEAPRRRRVGPAMLLGAAALVLTGAIAAAVVGYERRSTFEKQNVAVLLKQSTELPETRVITLLPDKLVLTWPKDDPYAAAQVVVIPEISVEIARPRLAEFKSYLETNREEFAQTLATDLPNRLRGFRLDPDGTGAFLLARAMHRSFNQLHPEMIQNLCPPDAASVPADCSGIVRIFFPRSFWLANAKD